MCKIIAIANQKGGTAKTTTAINLGIGLVNKGNKVLLVDLDPQGNATQGLGFDADSLEITVSTLLRKMISKNYTFMKKYGILRHSEGIDLMPANIELSVLETELISLFFGRERMLQTYLSIVCSEYDYIVIDCMPSLNLITINALVAANEVIIPLHAQYYSVKGLEQLLQTISSVKTNGLNESLKISGILYTCVNDRTTSFWDVQKIMCRGISLTKVCALTGQSTTARTTKDSAISISMYYLPCALLRKTGSGEQKQKRFMSLMKTGSVFPSLIKRQDSRKLTSETVNSGNVRP